MFNSVAGSPSSCRVGRRAWDEMMQVSTGEREATLSSSEHGCTCHETQAACSTVSWLQKCIPSPGT